jgi:hypothetical protein
MTLPKPGKDPKFPQNLRPISILSTTDKLCEKVILKIVQRHIEERGLLNASSFGFSARHRTTLQCMRLTDHATLNLKNNTFTAAVFLDIEKAVDTTWHLGLLYTLSELKLSVTLIKLISSFLSFLRGNSEFRSKVNCLHQGIYEQGCHKFLFCPPHRTVYIYDTLQTHGVSLDLFTDDACIYATDGKEGYVLRKLQRGLSAIEMWLEHWNIKMNEDKTQAIQVSHRLRPLRLILQRMERISHLSVM